MMISWHFLGFWKNKKMKFSMTVDLQKNVIFGLFTCLQILQPSEFLHFRCADVILRWFPAILRNSKKNRSFRWWRTSRKMFLYISYFSRFCSQMCELLHWRCANVMLWWFPAILRAFEKIIKIEVLNDRRPAEKCVFFNFHMFADFAATWVNYYILGVLMSYNDDFQPF